eukprot:3858393-Amphidinium_carterae.1
MTAMDTGNSVKRDARHLEVLNDATDYRNRQVMSPTPERDQAGRPKQPPHHVPTERCIGAER